jgi:hypothetical protein
MVPIMKRFVTAPLRGQQLAFEFLDLKREDIYLVTPLLSAPICDFIKEREKVCFNGFVVASKLPTGVQHETQPFTLVLTYCSAETPFRIAFGFTQTMDNLGAFVRVRRG